MPRFDRKKSPPDARDYKLVNYMDLTTPLPTQKVVWEDLTTLDQGAWGHCVGFGCAAWGNTAPIEDSLTNGQGHGLYYKAVELGGSYGSEDGSTVRDGARALRFYGYLDTYAFAYTLDDIKRWVLTQGPVIVGTAWLSDMMHPDSNGVVMGSGSFMGGHCYLLNGYDPATDMFYFINSWGTKFADGGRFYMRANDWFNNVYSYQLHGQTDGEACAAVETGRGTGIPEITPPLVPQQPGGCLSLFSEVLAGILMLLGRGTSQTRRPE